MESMSRLRVNHSELDGWAGERFFMFPATHQRSSIYLMRSIFVLAESNKLPWPSNSPRRKNLLIDLFIVLLQFLTVQRRRYGVFGISRSALSHRARVPLCTSSDLALS